MAFSQLAGPRPLNLSAMKKHDTGIHHPVIVRGALERSPASVIIKSAEPVQGFAHSRPSQPAQDRAPLNGRKPYRIDSKIADTTIKIATLPPASPWQHDVRKSVIDLQEGLPEPESERTRKLRQNMDFAVSYLRRSGSYIPGEGRPTRNPDKPTTAENSTSGYKPDPLGPLSSPPIKPVYASKPELTSRSKPKQGGTWIRGITKEHAKRNPENPPEKTPERMEPNKVSYTISEDFSDRQKLKNRERQLLAVKDRDDLQSVAERFRVITVLPPNDSISSRDPRLI
ncbi:hypothetical protein F5Y10DRAFT_194630 [Nemania abortiva]|nr:hypothetical protein F5Y10DRAFT_194630 [Nemania abortiva]